MSEHTPGPWIVGERTWEVYDEEGDIVAYCYVMADGVRKGQSQHNARLIAAAPDMLAALEKVMDCDVDITRCKVAIASVIRKAKGEAT